MKLFQKLVCMALTATATATASLSICAFAADYTFDTAADTDYYPSTSYEDTYGTAYHYGSKNLVDYQIPELPYGVLSTTQTGVMEKLRIPGLQQTVGGSASGVYGVDSGVGIPAVTPVISPYQEPAYTSAKDMERKDGSIGTLKIPSLDINMKVWEGETKESMKKGLGHYSSTSAWDGNNRAQASRRQASRSQRRFFAAREDLHAVGSRITCRMLAVGPRRCLVDCYGYDLDMTQREIRYAAIPDLRTEFHPGSEIDCIVKEYHPRTGELIVSAKETEVNPFFGAEERHPVGSRRFAMISGKYGGGVFCNLPDGVTCMCNYSYQHEDADFMVGERVMLMVQRYDQEKLQMYGKIMSKW